ncbi:MAG: hypothetical protein HLX50_11855, partial [Alteromonadaceae bacterium]|nr:hypothetical protein [Alteromonadaceae bacterium]
MTKTKTPHQSPGAGFYQGDRPRRCRRVGSDRHHIMPPMPPRPPMPPLSCLPPPAPSSSGPSATPPPVVLIWDAPDAACLSAERVT